MILVLGAAALSLASFYAGIAYRSRRAINAFANVNVIDTSALLDARFMALVEEGLISQPLVIPSQVIRELQAFADSSDKQYRLQHRTAKTVITELARLSTVESAEFSDVDADDQVVLVAVQIGGRVISNDKEVLAAAQDRGRPTLSINQLSQRLRASYKRGDVATVTILAKKTTKETYALTEHGTLAVVKGGTQRVGASQDVEITHASLHANGKQILKTRALKD